MNFAIEPVMGAINTALNNGLTGMGGSSKLVLGLILGGMMAIDMGGPINKAAYVSTAVPLIHKLLKTLLQLVQSKEFKFVMHLFQVARSGLKQVR